MLCFWSANLSSIILSRPSLFQTLFHRFARWVTNQLQISLDGTCLRCWRLPHRWVRTVASSFTRCKAESELAGSKSWPLNQRGSVGLHEICGLTFLCFNGVFSGHTTYCSFLSSHNWHLDGSDDLSGHSWNRSIQPDVPQVSLRFQR